MAWLYWLLSLCKKTGPYLVQPKEIQLEMTSNSPDKYLNLNLNNFVREAID